MVSDKYDEHNIYDFAFKYGLNWDHIESPEERVSVIEWTGLNDKNGNPIYEGHILTNVNGRYQYGYMGLIRSNVFPSTVGKVVTH